MNPFNSLKRVCYLMVSVLIYSCSNPQPLDLVITNGTIYTLNPALPMASTVGIKDQKIKVAGEWDELKDQIGSETTILDLEGQTMTPGWIEGHGHFMGMGYNKLQMDLRNISSYRELIDQVELAVKQSEPGQWILGRGWHQSKWSDTPDTLIKGFQTHHLLSSISKNNPVYLRHASGHAGFANAMAMDIAGIKNIRVEEGPLELNESGEIIRDELGNPTGIFNERAMELITRHIPQSTPETDRQALALAINECLSNGITSFHDAGIDQTTIDLYKEAIDNHSLPVRIWAMLSGRDSVLLENWYASGPEIGYGSGHLTIRSIKMYMDGALGSRGAWLLEPYSDRPGHTGHETTPIKTLLKVSTQALRNGFQVCSHAIGDRAIREVLNQYQKAFEQNPQLSEDPRFRIEHAQHINQADIPRFGALGVIAAMQGIHMASDRPWAIHRLGKQRIEEGAYVWQKLLQSGAVVVNGSDVPVEPLNPLPSFYATITRKTLHGTPPGGYESSQKMTREQALRSYTLDAAFSAFEEDVKGSIEIGKFADFTVFTRNIMEIPEDEILQTKVAYTVIGGKIYPQ